MLLMANPNPTDREREPVAEDRKVQAAVLEFLVGEDPDRFTIPELSRAMNAGWLTSVRRTPLSAPFANLSAPGCCTVAAASFYRLALRSAVGVWSLSDG
jgi:hypothetical protein